MKIEQFEDQNLSHYSYAILSECESQIVVIDPSRDIKPYLDFAARHQAKITGVIETHPHADFISGHIDLHQEVKATIYCSEFLAATYPHKFFDEGDTIEFGKIRLKALNTPGHSPDSICIILEYDGKDQAVFTGDTLFIGDCGRPDLRENTGNIKAKREELARQMYHSLRNKLMPLDNDVLVYPAHGAGTLCGKALSEANRSTIGTEKLSNWSLQEMSEEQFIRALTGDQPFIPKYFPYDVELNKKGAEQLEKALAKVKAGREIGTKEDADSLDRKIIIVDARPSLQFKDGHLRNSINIMANGKFETWLGSIVAPGEAFYLTTDNRETLQQLVARAAKIGYENFIKEAFILKYKGIPSQKADLDDFRKHPSAYTIIDVRNSAEASNPLFQQAINIPLPELRERINEIPPGKPVMVHCAGGYRSAAGSSIIENKLSQVPVFDLGALISKFQPG